MFVQWALCKLKHLHLVRIRIDHLACNRVNSRLQQLELLLVFLRGTGNIVRGVYFGPFEEVIGAHIGSLTFSCHDDCPFDFAVQLDEAKTETDFRVRKRYSSLIMR